MASKDLVRPLFGVPRLNHLSISATVNKPVHAEPTKLLEVKSQANIPALSASLSSMAPAGPEMVSETELKIKRSSVPKKMKDPLAPKRPPGSFFLYSKEERPKVVADIGSSALGVVATELGKRWADLDKEMKVTWEKRSREAMVQFEEEKKNYRPSEEFLQAAAAHYQKVSNKTKEGSSKVMKKMAPYFTYLIANWVKVATDMPGLSAKEVQEKIWEDWATHGKGMSNKKRKERDPMAPKNPKSSYIIFLSKIRPNVVKEHPDMSPKEVMGEVGQRWKKLGDEEKAPFVKEAIESSEEYQKELAKYKSNC